MGWDDIFNRFERIINSFVSIILNNPKVRGAFRRQEEILRRLDEIERLIQMTHDETIAKLNDVNATLTSVSADIDALLAIIAQLQNADTAPDVAALIDQADAIAHSADDKFAPPPQP